MEAMKKTDDEFYTELCEGVNVVKYPDGGIAVAVGFDRGVVGGTFLSCSCFYSSFSFVLSWLFLFKIKVIVVGISSLKSDNDHRYQFRWGKNEKLTWELVLYIGFGLRLAY